MKIPKTNIFSKLMKGKFHYFNHAKLRNIFCVYMNRISLFSFLNRIKIRKTEASSLRFKDRDCEIRVSLLNFNLVSKQGYCLRLSIWRYFQTLQRILALSFLKTTWCDGTVKVKQVGGAQAFPWNWQLWILIYCVVQLDFFITLLA